MNVHVTVDNPARSDTSVPGAGSSPTPPNRRWWAVAGVAAALTSLAAGVAASTLGAVYDPALATDAAAIAERLATQQPAMIIFHVATSLSAVLLTVFALGLHRRLASSLPTGSLLPAAAGVGLIATAVVLLLGTALDTEFIFATMDPDLVVPEAMVVYNHWVATVPGCWILSGLTGLALHRAARHGALPRWTGWVGFVLGTLTLIVGIAPMQYMAGLTGAIMVLTVSIGFCLERSGTLDC